MRFLVFVVVALVLLADSAALADETRVALVIGVANYSDPRVEKLANTLNDSRALARVLRERGFEVREVADPGRPEMMSAINAFTDDLSHARVGLFYFSGHGVQLNGANYLLPRDVRAQVSRRADLADQAVGVVEVAARMAEANAKAFHLLIIDACRNDPFPAASKGVLSGKGLTMPSANGVMILQAAGSNQTALDNLGEGDRDPNGLFTRELLKAIRLPGLPVRGVIQTVRDSVLERAASVGHEQRPALYDEAVGDFVFTPGQPVLPVPAPATASATSEMLFWQSIMGSSNPADFEAYLKRFGQDGIFAQPARTRLAGLSSVRPAPLPAPVPSAASVLHDCPDCPEMVLIPSGSFDMGTPDTEEGRNSSEGPVHNVTIRQAFYLGRYAVTFAEWDACVAGGGCGGYRPGDEGWGRDRRPVINVDWNNAVAYTKWLSRRTGQRYRLPSESEWEYAARAETRTAYYWGDEIGRGNANCYGCGSQWDDKQTAPVGSFQPNSFGLYDMSGNVWQWVQDCYVGNYNTTPRDSSAYETNSCSFRVLRGGSSDDHPGDLRAGNRYRFDPGGHTYVVGFRVARTLTP